MLTSNVPPEAQYGDWIEQDPRHIDPRIDGEKAVSEKEMFHAADRNAGQC